jgi:hypothetical protein
MADVINPYANNSSTAEARTHQQTIVHDLWNDERFTSPDLTETVRIGPDGDRQAEATRVLLRTQDGRVIRDAATEPLYACHTCNRHALHVAVMRACDECGTLACRSCIVCVEDDRAHELEFCRSCYRNWRRSWLFSLDDLMSANSIS